MQQTCNNLTFSTNTIYDTCISLPVLNSHLHWTYHPSNATVDVAFSHNGSDPTQWVAWAINVNRSGMIGAQALVAVPNTDGSIRAYTSSVTGYNTTLQPSNLTFDVPKITAERVNSDVVIYATLVLPSRGTAFNQVWQVGPTNNGAPVIHALDADNRNSVHSVDFSTGSSDSKSLQRLKNMRAVLRVVSRGVSMPLGVMMARYLKKDGCLRVCLHVTIQTTSYGIGVAIWVTGRKLHNYSHWHIGNILFALTTIQVFVTLFTPKPESIFEKISKFFCFKSNDNDTYRKLWKICHYCIGYSIIILNIIDVYKGLKDLRPEKTWLTGYTSVLVSLGVISGILEACTCGS